MKRSSFKRDSYGKRCWKLLLRFSIDVAKMAAFYGLCQMWMFENFEHGLIIVQGSIERDSYTPHTLLPSHCERLMSNDRKKTKTTNPYTRINTHTSTHSEQQCRTLHVWVYGTHLKVKWNRCCVNFIAQQQRRNCQLRKRWLPIRKKT